VLGAGSEEITDDSGTFKICSAKNASIVKWKSENSVDFCSADISGLLGENTSYGWLKTDYLKVGKSINISGDNKLKFLTVETTSGDGTLKCTDAGWVLESTSCKNRYSINNFPGINKITFNYNRGPQNLALFIGLIKHE
jgi:hypothetical protein